MIRTGDTVRFIPSVESKQALRVGNREGVVFPAHQVTGGLVLLATLSDAELAALYTKERYAGRPAARPNLRRLLEELVTIRRSGLAVNLERSEHGVAAVGRAVLAPGGRAVAGVSVSMPTVRYSATRLRVFDTALRKAAAAISQALEPPLAAAGDSPGPHTTKAPAHEGERAPTHRHAGDGRPLP